MSGNKAVLINRLLHASLRDEDEFDEDEENDRENGGSEGGVHRPRSLSTTVPAVQVQAQQSAARQQHELQLRNDAGDMDAEEYAEIDDEYPVEDDEPEIADPTQHPTQFAWMGDQARTSASLPPHLLLDELFMDSVASIKRRYGQQFAFLDVEEPQADEHEHPVVEVNNDALMLLSFRPDVATRKVYMTNLTLYVIFTFFFPATPPAMLAPIFTHINVNRFIEKYYHMPKRQLERGTCGLKIPSLIMVGKVAMVMNGMYKREHDLFRTYLQQFNFENKKEYFSENKGKPAVNRAKHNAGWGGMFQQHKRVIRDSVNDNALPNHQNIKTYQRLTDDEMWLIILSLVGSGGQTRVRDAALISTTMAACGRSGEIAQVSLKDVGPFGFTVGTNTRGLHEGCLYSAASGSAGIAGSG